MCMLSCYRLPMRTTIEIEDEHRARLLELAARRGEKGFSRLVNEALEQYLAAVERREEATRRALMLQGSLEEDQAAAMRQAVAELRKSWR
jgi:predicted transcriptional regulator